MVSASESSKFFALFSEKAAKFDETVSSKNVDDCRALILECQTLVSAHSAVLPARDLQVYKERIEEFKRMLDNIKQPKKKFGFSKATKQANESQVRNEKVDEAANGGLVDHSSNIQAPVTKTAAFSLDNCDDQQLQLNDVHGEVELRNLNRCSVKISGSPATLYMSEVHDCQIVCDPVASSVLIVGFRGSSLQVACQQLRIHKAQNAVFRLHIVSRSIIEDCEDVSFGDLPSDYPATDGAWEAAGILKTKNNYKLVDDFNWLNVQQPSPNWKLLE